MKKIIKVMLMIALLMSTGCSDNYTGGGMITAPKLTTPTENVIVEVMVGDNYTLEVGPNSQGWTFEWHRDGVKEQGRLGPVYTLENITADMDGAVYHCYVSNSAGSVDSPTFTIKIVEKKHEHTWVSNYEKQERYDTINVYGWYCNVSGCGYTEEDYDEAITHEYANPAVAGHGGYQSQVDLGYAYTNYQCKDCAFSTFMKGYMDNHLEESAHQVEFDDDLNEYYCNLCDEEITTDQEATKHEEENSKHELDLEKSKQTLITDTTKLIKGYYCVDCDWYFETEEEKNEHLASENCQDHIINSDVIIGYMMNVYVCHCCGKETLKEKEAADHVKNDMEGLYSIIRLPGSEDDVKYITNDQIFDTKEAVESYLLENISEQYHNEEIFATCVKAIGYQCKGCTFKTLDLEEMKEHDAANQNKVGHYVESGIIDTITRYLGEFDIKVSETCSECKETRYEW